MQPLQDFTDTLSEEAYSSVSYIKPEAFLLQPEEEGTELTQKKKKNILGYPKDKYIDPVTD